MHESFCENRSLVLQSALQAVECTLERQSENGARLVKPFFLWIHRWWKRRLLPCERED